MTTFFPTWPVDGPPPLPPVHGLLPAAAAPAAGVRFVVDTTLGPVDENAIAPDGAGLETGLFRRGTEIVLRVGGDDEVVFDAVGVLANPGQERWLSGVSVYPYPPDTPEGFDACASGSSVVEKGFGEALTPPEFGALTLELAITCTAQQVPNQEMFRARAVTALEAVESFGVARELMGGATLPTQPHLADSNATFPNGQTATRPNHALQVLEEAIALTGRLGLIHCSPMLATALLGQGFVISDKSGVIRSINGNVVIPDAGYVGVSRPTNGVAPTSTEEWIYATGPVDVRRSAVFTTPDTVAQALDRGTAGSATNGRSNQITYRAERFAVTVWDTALQAAVLVDRCSSDCGVGS